MLAKLSYESVPPAIVMGRQELNTEMDRRDDSYTRSIQAGMPSMLWHCPVTALKSTLVAGYRMCWQRGWCFR